MQDFGISMYLVNMDEIAKNEADKKIKEYRKNKVNKYEYQVNVNTFVLIMGRLLDIRISENSHIIIIRGTICNAFMLWVVIMKYFKIIFEVLFVSIVSYW